MIRSVRLGEEVAITAKNKVGLLADIAQTLANQGINIEAVLGYEAANTAKLLLVTNANIRVIGELRQKKYKAIVETDVVIVDLENKPGALKVVTTELAQNKIDIKHLYVTSSSSGGYSKMVLQTSDNETAIAVLTRLSEAGTN